jgi:DNA processing protein
MEREMEDSEKDWQPNFPFSDSGAAEDVCEEGTRGPNADDTRHLKSLAKRLDAVFQNMDSLCSDAAEPMDLIRSAIHRDRVSYMRLALVPGVGSMTMMRLLAQFGDAAATLKASLSQLGQVHRVGPRIASEIRESNLNGDAERVLDHCGEHEINIVLPGDKGYPRKIENISDPPLLLFMRGSYRGEDELAIGMVGTRHATHYGRVMAERISRGLCAVGVTIVSGLARGIDAVCHQAALDCGGRTIAVLGSSLSDVYPPEHFELAQRICEQGCLFSETPPFSKPKPGVFPQRNRIISGLSNGVVVVEAADRSGSLITARHAGDQGRDVFAVPGPVTSRTSRGCNQLIRDGAVLVQDADEIIEHLGPLAQRVVKEDGTVIDHPCELQLNDVEQAVLNAIGDQPTDVDIIVSSCGLQVSCVLSTLSVLEIKGLIVRATQRAFVRRHY